MSADSVGLKRQHVASCLKQRDEALSLLQDLEASGIRTWEQHADEPMVETTQKRVTFLRNLVKAMEDLLMVANSS